MTVNSLIGYRNLGEVGMFFLNPPAHIDHVYLSAGVAKSYTIPDDTQYLVFSATVDNWYVNPNGVAVVPTGDISDGSGSAHEPTQWVKGDMTTISFICSANCVITISAYGG